METTKQQETRTIARVFLFAFLLNLFLAGIKTVLAIHSESFAVTAGAIDSITDAVASLAVYAGILVSGRSTSAFPLGLYKIENVLSIVIAFFIFLTGYEVARRVFSGHQENTSVSLATIIWLGLVTVAIFLFGRYVSAVGRRTGSPTLKAEGRHRQADVLANLVVFAAVIFQYFGLHLNVLGVSVDQWAAVLVLVFVVATGWELLADAMRVLLDASTDHATLNRVRTVIMQEPSVVEIKSLLGRNAGRFLFLQVDVVLRVKDLEKAHLVSEKLEKRIKHEIPAAEQVMIHYEPQMPETLCFAVPLQDKQGVLSEHFGGAPYFALIHYDLASEDVGEQEILVNPYLEIERRKGLRVAEWLVGLKVDRLLIKDSLEGKGPEYVFNDAGVRIETTTSTALRDVALGPLI